MAMREELLPPDCPRRAPPQELPTSISVIRRTVLSDREAASRRLGRGERRFVRHAGMRDVPLSGASGGFVRTIGEPSNKLSALKLISCTILAVRARKAWTLNLTSWANAGILQGQHFTRDSR